MKSTTEPMLLSPVYQARVWGGDALEARYGRDVPLAAKPCGESWEVCDRPEAQSTVRSGSFAGTTLHELWRDHREAIFGKNAPNTERFPLLLKILDCREVLSLQVHPPAEKTPIVGGEPKTEMWYIAHAEPGAVLFVGLARATTPEEFAAHLQAGTVEPLLHRIPVQTGDFIFIPSGRLHAIGGGLIIFEIQQNSDTTFRVFDWNRCGTDGLPRPLHVAQSLECINFQDVRPTLGSAQGNTLVQCPHFTVQQYHAAQGATLALGAPGNFATAVLVSGRATMDGLEIAAGDHALIPATCSARDLQVVEDSVVLIVTF